MTAGLLNIGRCTRLRRRFNYIGECNCDGAQLPVYCNDKRDRRLCAVGQTRLRPGCAIAAEGKANNRRKTRSQLKLMDRAAAPLGASSFFKFSTATTEPGYWSNYPMRGAGTGLGGRVSNGKSGGSWFDPESWQALFIFLHPKKIGPQNWGL